MQRREINVWKVLQVLFFVFSKLLYRIFFRENAKPNDLYRKVWRKTTSENDQKMIEIPVFVLLPSTYLMPLLKDLKSRLENTRFGTVLKNSKFSYGFSPDYLQTLTKYWKDHYKWRQHEQELNKYPHFKITIEGLDVHFMHVKFNPQEQSKRSFTDFRKIIPLLTMSRPGHKIVFNVVCPSIPGSGFSEAPQQEGFNAKNLSDILGTLMDRLGYSKFYVHGNGWGSVIASVMARYYPTKVKGLHVTMCFSLPNVFDSLIRSVVVSICPFLISSAESRIIFPLKKRLRILFEETGSLHMLSTKPDILGCALTDSPVGMAACVLENFVWI
ncbi:epoxide hydrolase 1 [Caerostris extrusa]|uniref:Epoxide hydrolase 1 n=1 Tax=Caerostris extrusa TaxID=172846 RepID=A0AAV4SMP2_CAEEX|nr:epoxide hydrolase 1 [Caerostris extrusa]